MDHADVASVSLVIVIPVPCAAREIEPGRQGLLFGIEGLGEESGGKHG